MGSCTYLPATLKKRVTIQNPTRVSDGQGGYTVAWADGSTVYCSIDTLSGYERFQAAQLATPVSHKIVMRFNREVSTQSRLKFGDRYFGVKEAIDKDEDRRFLTIKAIETEVVEADIGALLLESGGYLLTEDGGRLLLGGTASSIPGILLENGSHLLLESGGNLLLEM